MATLIDTETLNTYGTVRSPQDPRNGQLVRVLWAETYAYAGYTARARVLAVEFENEDFTYLNDSEVELTT